MKKRITILVPTYNRPNKLARLIFYISLCVKSGKLPLGFVNILIVDGSETENAGNANSIAKLVSEGLGIKLIRRPGLGLKDRFLIGARIIETEYVLACGDDDLPDFIGIDEWLRTEDDINQKMVFAGRFTNIYGLSVFNLVTKDAERPYRGFKIESSNPLIRVSQYALANAFGVSSLAYSIQPTEIFMKFWEDVEKSNIDYHHAGLELMHQTYLTSQLPVDLSDANIIFRDFSYIGYMALDEREAPTDDPYPYYGLAAVEKCMEYLSCYCKVPRKDSESAVRDIINMNKKIKISKISVQSKLENVNDTKFNRLPGYLKKEIEAAWRGTYFSCYPKIEAAKKILILSMPGAVINHLRNLKRISIENIH